MRFFVYDMLVNVNVIYYVHVCEQAHWARSAGNSAIENLCIIIIIILKFETRLIWKSHLVKSVYRGNKDQAAPPWKV